MKILILNGNPENADSAFDGYLSELEKLLTENGHQVSNLTLRDMDIKYCIGCFGCWVKTPGECSAAKDDSKTVRHDFVNADLAIFASPIIMGFTSAVLKKAHDKLVAIVLPYVDIYHGESHHVPRYDKYPLMGVLLQPEADTDEEDLDIINNIYRRDSLNFHSRVAVSRLTTDPVKEVADEINRL